jgi:hypothetical protein
MPVISFIYIFFFKWYPLYTSLHAQIVSCEVCWSSRFDLEGSLPNWSMYSLLSKLGEAKHRMLETMLLLCTWVQDQVLSHFFFWGLIPLSQNDMSFTNLICFVTTSLTPDFILFGLFSVFSNINRCSRSRQYIRSHGWKPKVCILEDDAGKC